MRLLTIAVVTTLLISACGDEQDSGKQPTAAGPVSRGLEFCVGNYEFRYGDNNLRFEIIRLFADKSCESENQDGVRETRSTCEFVQSANDVELWTKSADGSKSFSVSQFSAAPDCSALTVPGGGANYTKR